MPVGSNVGREIVRLIAAILLPGAAATWTLGTYWFNWDGQQPGVVFAACAIALGFLMEGLGAWVESIFDTRASIMDPAFDARWTTYLQLDRDKDGAKEPKVAHRYIGSRVDMLKFELNMGVSLLACSAVCAVAALDSGEWRLLKPALGAILVGGFLLRQASESHETLDKVRKAVTPKPDPQPPSAAHRRKKLSEIVGRPFASVLLTIVHPFARWGEPSKLSVAWQTFAKSIWGYIVAALLLVAGAILFVWPALRIYGAGIVAVGLILAGASKWEHDESPSKTDA